MIVQLALAMSGALMKKVLDNFEYESTGYAEVARLDVPGKLYPVMDRDIEQDTAICPALFKNCSEIRMKI